MSIDKTMKDHMDAVRKITGVSGLLSLASATDDLNSQEHMDIIIINGINKDINFDNINILSLYHVYPEGGSSYGPVAKKWWYILTLPTDDGKVNNFQVLFPDDGSGMYVRVKTSSAWHPYVKIGGGIITFLKCFGSYLLSGLREVN